MAHILAIRFSALGDIAMTVPVLLSFARRYPMHEITLLSRDSAAALFNDMPTNCHFYGVNLRNYGGVLGLTRLFHELETFHFDAVADFHDVLRTKYLRIAFHTIGIRTASINKDRSDRRALTRAVGKKMVPLTGSPERYAKVLAELGYPFEISFKSIYGDKCPALSSELHNFTKECKGCWVGIAPFARHEGKIYPLGQMEIVIRMLSNEKNVDIFLFGSGEKEKEWSSHCEDKYPNVTSFIGKFNLQKELLLMSHLNVMITMDSANMHLASLVNTPVISIWGATHPYAGFAGTQAKGSLIVQNDMSCRPCSIFGNKPCMKGNFECIRTIKPERIVAAVKYVCN